MKPISLNLVIDIKTEKELLEFQNFVENFGNVFVSIPISLRNWRELEW